MPFRDDLLNEIPGENPGGINLRYEPIYDQIKEARREVDAVPEGADESERKVADFKLVVKLAGDALAKESKDLWLAAWLTEAVLKREGIAGFRNCLEMIAGLLDKFWEHLHPAIEDPDDIELRSAPLSWVGQYLVFPVHDSVVTKQAHTYLQYREAQAVPTEESAKGDSDKTATRDQALADGKLSPEDFESGVAATPKQWYKDLSAELKGCGAALDSIQKLADQRFTDVDLDDRPGFKPLRDALQDVGSVVQLLLKRKLEEDPDPESEMEDEDEAEGAAAADGDAVVSIDPNSVRDAATRIAAAAKFLQKEEPTNPASYLMLRGFRWGELRVNGADLDPRLLSAPPTPVREKLKRLLLDGKWDALLASAEGVMAQAYGRGWLDLQRYVITACEALGSEYDHVAAGIRGAIASLLRDIPNLAQLTLMDDTQTANAETKAWLREQLAAEQAAGRVAISLPEDEDGVVAPAAQPEEAPEALFERAVSLMRGGRPEKGIELLLSAAEKEKSPRERFLRRAQAAGIMVDSGNEPIALPILRELSDQIEGHKLEAWESGDTVARPLGLLYRCLNALQTESEDVRNNLYLRICRLDPIQAMTFRDAGKTAASTESQPEAVAAPPVEPAAGSDGGS